MRDKIIDLYILDKNFQQVDVIDYYTNMSWKRGIYGNGECEVEIPITDDAPLQSIQIGYYIARGDDEMVCQISYREIKETDGGDVLAITAADITKVILNKRIIWNNMMFTGSVETFISKLITENFSRKAQIERRRMISLDGVTDLISVNIVGINNANESFSFESSHEKIGDCIADLCETYHYGMLMTLNFDTFTGIPHLVLNIFKPTNRSNYVIFSEGFDNVISTNYTSDFVLGTNLVLVGGEITDEDLGTRHYQSVGTTDSGLDRNETYVDAKNVTSKQNWVDFLKEWPMKDKIYDFPWDWNNGGTFVEYKEQVGDDEVTLYHYRYPVVKIPIQDDNQYDVLKNSFSDHVWCITKQDGVSYFCINNADIAVFDRDILNNPPYYNPDDPDDPNNEFVPADPNNVWDGGGTFKCNVMCYAEDVLYSAMLINEGYKEFSITNCDRSFSAEIDANVTFKYKTDYIIGDYVGIMNKYGIKGVVQITTITETIDPTGYHFDITADNAKSKDQFDVLIYTQNDVANGIYILGDDGKYLCM